MELGSLLKPVKLAWSFLMRYARLEARVTTLEEKLSRELEQQLMKAEDWAAEKERYVLHAVDRGAFAYVLKPGVETADPPHWLCQQCF